MEPPNGALIRFERSEFFPPEQIFLQVTCPAYVISLSSGRGQVTIVSDATLVAAPMPPREPNPPPFLENNNDQEAERNRVVQLRDVIEDALANVNYANNGVEAAWREDADDPVRRLRREDNKDEESNNHDIQELDEE